MYCLFCVVLCIVCVYVCTVLLPPGGYPIAVNKYISYHTGKGGKHGMWALRLTQYGMEVKESNVQVKRQREAGCTCVSWNKRCSTRQHGVTSQKTITTRHGTTITAITHISRTSIYTENREKSCIDSGSGYLVTAALIPR
jgi:hypothetical protein